ncbi:BamA/TamA family outer membrane protein [candidate division WOR-3 bacterium]|nr:BamA/TamA family outer membrane protein [candidate division WOR-3 bacterium]
MIVLLLFLAGADEFRFRVASIEVEGNEYFKSSAITRVMLTRTRNILRKGIFNEQIFMGDVEAIRNLYAYDGFLDIEVDYELHYDSTAGQVDILLNIAEGGQYLVDRVDYRGNTVIDAESLDQQVTIKPGQIFDPRKVDVDNYVIRYRYDDLGYADVRVMSGYHAGEYRIQVVHQIDEGKKQYVGRVEITGLERTRESVVARELKIIQGELFRYARVLESRRRLFRLGVFAAIRTRVEDSGIANRKDIRFILTERERAALDCRIGYGTRDRLRLGAGVTHYNMFGRAWQGSVDGKVSFAEQRLISQVTFPRSILMPGDFGFGVFAKRLDEIGYQTRSLGGNVTTRFELKNHELSAKYELERIRTYYATGDSSRTDLLHRIYLGWLNDHRDDPFYTTRGHYFGANLEVSGIILPSDVDYLRPVVQYRFYRPAAGLVFGAAVKAGLAVPVASTVEIPIYKRFYCGGASSVRGYAERAIGPVDVNGNPVGGQVLGECSFEMRFPIYRVLAGVIFLDGGNIWPEPHEVDPSLRWGIGAGLRLKTFLGSIRLDYGFKIGRAEDEGAGALHFAIGEAF